MYNVLWFKRDLRLRDHQPLLELIDAGRPSILVYIFEDLLLDNPHYDERHWRFIWQSLLDIDAQLQPFGGRLHIYKGDALAVFESLHNQYGIETLYSHEETGLQPTTMILLSHVGLKPIKLTGKNHPPTQYNAACAIGTNGINTGGLLCAHPAVTRIYLGLFRQLSNHPPCPGYPIVGKICTH